MGDHKKKKKFLNMPKYPGGSEAFRKIIAENLQYPAEALQRNVEGSVIVGYDVLDTGAVANIHVIKGLGYGCDEEAMRVIGLLEFEKVHNRGLRLRMSTKTTIHFRLPGVKITYVNDPPSPPSGKPDEKPQGPQETRYEYTITF